jgi:hypothetical protein
MRRSKLGHANVENLSRLFVRRLYAKGQITIAEAVQAAQEAGETLRASEGEYNDPNMISQGMEEIVEFLRTAQPPHHTPVLAPKPGSLTEQQRTVLRQWDDDEGMDLWDEPEYAIFDSIPWIFAPGWRKRYKDVPILTHVTN